MIGAQLRKLRKQSGVSQAELAERLHISRQSISKWENDLSSPDVEMLIKLSQFYHLSIDEIVNNPLHNEEAQSSSDTPLKINEKQQISQLLSHYESYFILMMILLCCTIAPLGILFIGICVRWNQRVKTKMKHLNYGVAIAAFVYNVIMLWLLIH